MPTYDYTCKACGHKLEAFQKITDSPLTKCPSCGKDTLIRGVGGGIGLSFTGDGFYKTMYGPKNPGESKESGEAKGNASKGNELKANSESKGTNTSNPSSGCCPCGKNKGACNKDQIK